MITKTYKAVSKFSCTLLVGGVKRHFSFLPFSYGGSTYTTSNEKEQEALEKSRYFGGVFDLVETHDDAHNAVETNLDETPEEVENISIKEVEVADIAQAKTYLVENCGYARTQLRSMASILAAAESKGIKFIGI